jgi:hypothetical protein
MARDRLDRFDAVFHVDGGQVLVSTPYQRSGY